MDEIEVDGGRPILFGLVFIDRVFEREWYSSWIGLCWSILPWASRIDGKYVS